MIVLRSSVAATATVEIPPIASAIVNTRPEVEGGRLAVADRGQRDDSHVERVEPRPALRSTVADRADADQHHRHAAKYQQAQRRRKLSRRRRRHSLLVGDEPTAVNVVGVGRAPDSGPRLHLLAWRRMPMAAGDRVDGGFRLVYARQNWRHFVETGELGRRTLGAGCASLAAPGCFRSLLHARVGLPRGGLHSPRRERRHRDGVFLVALADQPAGRGLRGRRRDPRTDRLTVRASRSASRSCTGGGPGPKRDSHRWIAWPHPKAIGRSSTARAPAARGRCTR